MTINTPDYSSEYAVSNELLNNPSLEFRSGEVKRFLVEFSPNPSDVEKEIQIGSINLLMGNAKNCSIDLKFCSSGSNNTSVPQEFTYLKLRGVGVDFDAIRPLVSTQIIPRHSRLKIDFEHDKPALSGEWYPIKVKIMNQESFSPQNMSVEYSLIDDNLDSCKSCF